MADEIEETGTDTPIGDQVAADTNTQQALTEQPAEAPAPSELDDDVTTDGTFTAVDGSERPNYGYHDGHFYATFTVKAGGGPLSAEQLNDCAGEVRLHAVNNGYIAVDNSHDVTTQTSADGLVSRVIVAVPVRENTVKAAGAAAQDETPES